ncbi:DUF7344 domain-containing protein [Natronomonas amylolytica]|uniref:DUF7344 domain-containing protein n=1 Tax=Natronomonas amylolytica TaxID=3108498 RepID=UPI003008F00E
MQLLKKLKDTVAKQDSSNRSTIDSDDAYYVLSNDRRRRVVEFLAEYEVGAEVSVSTLADRLSDGQNRTACYVALHQNHLGVLSVDDGVGVIDYDNRAQTVVVRPELFSLHRAHEHFENEL